MTGTALDPEPSATTPDPGRGRRRDWLTTVLPAVLVYVPLLLTKPGWVGADTKTYLYLDPGGLLADAPYLWDSQIGMGTVTHQTIGYLFPMGPFYLALEALGVPDWTAQRLWLGTVLLAAGLGVRYLLRTFGWAAEGARRGGLLVAMLAYMLSPYLLSYAARISVILLPWAALPWLIALTARAVRAGGWRHPAWFAVVVLLVGGINATALLLVGLGPLLWLCWAVWVDREARFGQAAAAAARIGVLTVATSLWWMAGLWAQGRYGLPVTRYTETYRTVAELSTAPEVLRGLGYWFFYGNDKLGPWIEPNLDYTSRTPLLVLSYLLPVAALAVAGLVRWRYRAYALGLVVVGALTAIGAHPWDAPSALGGLFATFTRTDTGLSLRSTPRAVPLVVLGTAVLLGAGIDALGRRVPRAAVPAAVAACLLIVANLPPLWTGTMVADNLKRPEELPASWLAAAEHLDAGDRATRVLEVPGIDFASYRWGNTVDPVLPGLMDRSYVARELFQWGSPQSANLLNALDRRFHEETLEPEAVAPIARLMGAGEINVRSDLQYERYRTARPRTLWDLLSQTPGLGEPVAFGPPTPNVAGPQQTMVDEVELGAPVDLADAPPVAAFPVDDATPMTRALSASQPLLAAADGEGLVDAAAAGLIGRDQAVFYDGSFATDDAGWHRVYDAGADLLLTDTNRQRARRWGALRENTGYTEREGETPTSYDPTDQRLDVFPGAGPAWSSLSEQRTRADAAVGATATASAYGNPITYTPDDRPTLAIDGDPETAWRVGAVSTVDGESLTIDLDEPVTTDRVNLLQPINLERTRWITRARLVFDDDEGGALEVDLTDVSRDESAVGQDVTFPSRTFEQLRIEVLDTNIGTRPLYDGVSGVGFAEVRIDGVGIDDVVRMPTAMLDRAGPSSIDHRLTVLATRLRSNPAEPVRTDEESAIRRVFTLPTARAFALSGTARLSAYLPDHRIDELLGLPGADDGGVTARADVHLPGNNRQRASAAIDGDPTTFWSSIFQRQTGHWLEYELAEPLTVERLDLELVNDGRHSLPTRLLVSADGGEPVAVDVPAVPDVAEGEPGWHRNATVSVPVELPTPVTGRTIRVTIDAVREVATQEWYSSGFTITPVAIAELGIDGIRLAPPAATFDTGCRDDLVAVDGRPVPVRVTGPTDDALDRRALPVLACDGAAAALELSSGEHLLRTGVGRDEPVGVDVDRLALTSDVGGDPLPADDLPSAVPAGPATQVSMGRTTATIEVAASDDPSWLVFGQSYNRGFTARVGDVDLGPPTVVQGYANGWYLDPAVLGAGPHTVTVEWAPQRVVWVGLVLSGVAGLACLALLLLARRDPSAADPRPAAANADPLTPLLTLPWPFVRTNRDDGTPTGRTINRPRTGPDDLVSRRAAAAWGLAVAVFVALDAPTQWGFPLLGVPLGLLTAWVLRRPRARGWSAIAAAGCLSLAAAYIVVQQRRWRFVPNFAWPTHFSRAHIVALVAVFLLAIEAVRWVVRERARNRRGAAAIDAHRDDAPTASATDPPPGAV